MKNGIEIKGKRILTCVYCGAVIGTTLEGKDTIGKDGYCVCESCGSKEIKTK